MKNQIRIILSFGKDSDMRKKSALFLICCFIICLVGCGEKIKTEHSQKNSQVELTSRQKKILKEAGLSTNYDDLLSSQRIAIKRIEELYKYLDSEYDEEFIYEGYIAPNSLQDEQLIVYPQGLTESDIVTVTVSKIDDKEIITDDYLNLLLRDDYESYIKNIIVKLVNSENVKVYSEITEVKDKNNSEYDNNVSAMNKIFILSTDDNKEMLDKLNKKYKESLESHKLYSVNKFYIMEENAFEKIIKYNYEEYLNDDNIVAKFRCSLSE